MGSPYVIVLGKEYLEICTSKEYSIKYKYDIKATGYCCWATYTFLNDTYKLPIEKLLPYCTTCSFRFNCLTGDPYDFWQRNRWYY
jgi:hypothetical protein